MDKFESINRLSDPNKHKKVPDILR